MEQLRLKKKAEQYYQRCLELEKEGSYSAAILSCEWAIKYDSNNKEYENKLEELTLQQSLKARTPLEIAKECYQKSLKLKEEGNYKKAIETIKKAIELDAENILYKNELEELQILLNKQKEIEKYEEAIKEAKKYYKNALNLEKQGNYKEAIKLLNNAIELDPKNEEYQKKKEEVILIVEKENRSINYYNQAIESEKAKNYKRAIKYYNKAINELNPRYKNKIIKLYEKIINILLEEKKCLEVIEYYNKIIGLKPAYPEYYQKKIGRIENKIKEKEEKKKKQAEEQYKNAKRAALSEKYEDAIDYCRKAIKLDPNNKEYQDKIPELKKECQQRKEREERERKRREDLWKDTRDI